MARTSRKKTGHPAREVAHAISLFFAVRRLVRMHLAEGRKIDPSSWLRIETMKFIADHNGPKMKDVADYLSVTAPSATSLIGGLIKSKLVASSLDQSDRRTSRLVLTTKGKHELATAIMRGTKRLSGLFAGLSSAELAAFIRTLERIKETSAER